jgi:hypothetical protein
VVPIDVPSRVPRSAVTGILSGSLQKVTIDRVLRLLEAAGLAADIPRRSTFAAVRIVPKRAPLQDYLNRHASQGI